MTEGFKSKEIILQAQKKILGKVTNKNVVKLFIDERNSSILDNLYRLAKIYVSLHILYIPILTFLLNLFMLNRLFIINVNI